MKLTVFGATGRVGASFVDRAITAGHEVMAFVRDPARVANPLARIIIGQITDPAAVTLALQAGCDAVIFCVGAGPLKPSTVVTDSMRVVVGAMQALGIERLLAVSGTAEMPDKTAWGRLYTSLLRRTPVGHAVRDHDGAYASVAGSGLSWVLAGCNYIANGPPRGTYVTASVFPGGFKIIHPGDVADFLLRSLDDPTRHQQILGIWYGRRG
jgi:uncharacterized protein